MKCDGCKKTGFNMLGNYEENEFNVGGSYCGSCIAKGVMHKCPKDTATEEEENA